MRKSLKFIAAMLLCFLLGLNAAFAAGGGISSPFSELMDFVFRESGSGILTLGPEMPSTFTHEGVTYRSGFCEDAFLHSQDMLGEAFFEDENYNTYHFLENSNFSIVFRLDGMLNSRPFGELYCAEADWEAARAHYADPASWDYCCCFKKGIGIDPDPDYRSLPDVDINKFLELEAFSHEYAYNPFSFESRNDFVRMPLSDALQHPIVYFSRISKDGFLEAESRTFHFVDGRLLLLYQYDLGYGEYEDLLAVEIPTGLNEYFAPILEKIQENGT